MRTRIKICGITRLDDALAAAELGVDALGFVFYSPSPRAITPQNARQIIKELPPFVTTLALFVNEDHDVINKTMDLTGIDVIQFHGDENQAFCERFNRPFIKALRVNSTTDINAEIALFPSAKAILLDAFVAGVPGGTGQIFNWQKIPKQRPKPLVLAGGLDSANVADAIEQVKPAAIDVSGGVERHKGIKDFDKMQQFIFEVRRVSCSSGIDS